MMVRIPAETKIVVVKGGWSAEREVSLASGEACTRALRTAGFDVVELDATHRIAADLERLRPHVVFNALHGKFGEDGCLSAILETLRIPYTHSGVLASAIAMHKEKSKIVFRAAGLAVAESKMVLLEKAASSHPFVGTYVLKPVEQGSSVGVHIVDPAHQAPCATILKEREIFGTHVMAEKFIPGRELTCAIMGDVALGVIDIVSNATFYDYRAKYDKGGSRHILPADLPADVYRKVQKASLLAYRALGCRGVARADFRLDDTHGFESEPILLEINTNPGMTSTSLVPELAAYDGHSFPDLVTWMVNDASIDR